MIKFRYGIVVVKVHLAAVHHCGCFPTPSAGHLCSLIFHSQYPTQVKMRKNDLESKQAVTRVQETSLFTVQVKYVCIDVLYECH